MPLLLRGRIVTWCSVLLLCPLAGMTTFFFAWNVSRQWPNPDNVTKIFKIAAMILNALFAVKCLFMVHSLRLKSKALSFALFCALGVAATIANCCWFAFMITRKGYDQLCGELEKTCQRKVLTIAFSAFIIVYAILTFLVMLVVFYFDAHWNYAAPQPGPAAPPQPYTQIPATTAQSLRKYLPAASRFSSWSTLKSSSRRGDAGKGRHVPLINITHDYEDDEPNRALDGESSVLFDSAGADGLDDRSVDRKPKARSDRDAPSATSSEDDGEDDESDEEAQLEYERRRRERKGKYRADEEV